MYSKDTNHNHSIGVVIIRFLVFFITFYFFVRQTFDSCGFLYRSCQRVRTNGWVFIVGSCKRTLDLGTRVKKKLVKCAHNKFFRQPVSVQLTLVSKFAIVLTLLGHWQISWRLSKSSFSKSYSCNISKASLTPSVPRSTRGLKIRFFKCEA